MRLHEYAHELLHWGEDQAQFTKVVKECQAEATSFVVAQYLGLEAPYSAEYLTIWGTKPDVLRAQLEVVSRAASHIIQALQLTGKVDEDPAAEEVA